MDLMEAGVVTNRRKNVDPDRSVACRCLGTRRLYQFVHENPRLELRTTDEVCSPCCIGRHERMVAVVRASQVDLTGQVLTPRAAGCPAASAGGPISCAARHVPTRPASWCCPPTPGRCALHDPAQPRPGAAVVATAAEVHHVVTEFARRTCTAGRCANAPWPHPSRPSALPRGADGRGEAPPLVYADQMLPPPDGAMYPEHVEATLCIDDQLTLFFRPVPQRRTGGPVIHLPPRRGDHPVPLSRRDAGDGPQPGAAFVNVDYSDTMTSWPSA